MYGNNKVKVGILEVKIASFAETLNFWHHPLGVSYDR